MLPDGNADFTRLMGMLVQRTAQGMRSWRSSMHVENGIIRQKFVEPGLCDHPPGVGVKVSYAKTMLRYLQERK